MEGKPPSDVETVFKQKSGEFEKWRGSLWGSIQARPAKFLGIALYNAIDFLQNNRK